MRDLAFYRYSTRVLEVALMLVHHSRVLLFRFCLCVWSGPTPCVLADDSSLDLVLGRTHFLSLVVMLLWLHLTVTRSRFHVTGVPLRFLLIRSFTLNLATVMGGGLSLLVLF
jgi:hypothetical protein